MTYTSREEDEQIAFVQWCDILNIPVIHIPNEGKRSAYMGAKLKSMGLRGGVPDLLIPCARGGYHGLFIEMKVGNNKPTEKQKQWLQRLSEGGYACTVCYGTDEAIRATKKYFNLGGN